MTPTDTQVGDQWGEPCQARGEIRVIGGNQCRFIERELEGDKWEIIGPAHPPTSYRKTYPESEGEIPPCDGCGGSSRYWHAESRLWNLVMGGPAAKGDPGGVLCPNCFIDRAAVVGAGRRWVVTDVDPDASYEGEGLREKAAEIVSRWANWIVDESADMDVDDHAAGRRKVYDERDQILQALQSASGK